jgi:hypothetical protein
MCRIVQCEDCMRANGYHKYELLTCVSIIQRKGCMGATEDRKYELLACVSIHSTREQVRAQVRADGVCQHHTEWEPHARERVLRVTVFGSNVQLGAMRSTVEARGGRSRQLNSRAGEVGLEIAVRLQLRSPTGLCRVAGPVRAQHALSRRPGTQ